MKFITNDHQKIYYELLGDNNSSLAVAFFNGILSNTDSWQPFLKPFIKSGFKILVHDFRGQLRSNKPDENYSFEQHVDDFISLLYKLKIDHINIIGTSYGGIVAQEVAIKNPEKVKTLSLISTLSETDSHFHWFVNEWKNLCTKREKKNFFNNLAPIIYSNNYFFNHYEHLINRKNNIMDIEEEYWDGLVSLFNNTLKNTNTTSRLKKIDCPTLIAVGNEDLLTPIKFSNILNNHIQNSELIVIPECGHASCLEKKELLSGLTLGFILQNLYKFSK